MIHYYTDETVAAGVLIEQSILELTAASDEFPSMQHLVIQFSHTQYYLPDRPALKLIALVSVYVAKGAAVTIEGSIFQFSSERMAQLRLLKEGISDGGSAEEKWLKAYCELHSLPWLIMSAPWLLAPVHIPKPWGQEVWYTGIETRGQVGVVAAKGEIPLPWLLDLLSDRFGLADAEPPILLKVLDPLPDEVYGDLYFELHQQKQEVYVVTHIDQKAWPSGVGAIQLGFAPRVRQGYKTGKGFKQAYLQSVRAYESVRRSIDSLLDAKKAAAGIEASQPVTQTQQINWINDLSQHSENKELFDAECQLRKAMHAFVEDYPLSVGDVVAIPKLVPHALQHGVRVLEFQTPVYERKILSFCQKVLTQPDWDTEQALELVDLDFSGLQLPELVSATHQSQVERIVNFDAFEVLRVRLTGQYLLDGSVYSILMVLQGELALEAASQAQNIGAGQALLLPRLAEGYTMTTCAGSTFLLALPRQPSK